jgi:hypothetical protein
MRAERLGLLPGEDAEGADAFFARVAGGRVAEQARTLAEPGAVALGALGDVGDVAALAVPGERDAVGVRGEDAGLGGPAAGGGERQEAERGRERER